MRGYEKSRELYGRAKNSMAGGVSSHFRMGGAPHPLFFTHGAGSKVFDVDGNEYVDFTLGQGPLLLGHSHPHVLQTVAAEMERGQLYAGQHELELQLAETIQRLVPCAELIRFSNSGSEAVQAALRLARAFTGRIKYIKFEGHYHGWFDNVLINPTPATAGQASSAIAEVLLLPWNDLQALEEAFARNGNEIAAVITEPIMCNSGCIEPQVGFLQGIQDICRRYGAVLIFDEIITGFRLGLGGAQVYYGVTPDLAVFGKAMASGFTLSLLAGKKEIMELVANGTVMHAGTYNSNNPSIAAAAATIAVLEDGGQEIYRRLFSLGARLKEGLRDLACEAGHMVLMSGPGPMIHIGFTARAEVKNYQDTLDYDMAKYARFAKAMLDRGVRLIGRGIWYVSTAHSEDDIEFALFAAREAFRSVKQ